MASSSKSCAACRDGKPLDFPFSMAFHPIVDAARGQVWGYEALVRGPEGQSAGSVLGQVDELNRYKFDQACRVRAIELAGRLFPVDGDTRLSINFMPNAVYEPAACIRASLEAAKKVGFRHDRIMFEFTEDERIADVGHVERIIAEYKRQGFLTAIDDFGAGYAGLGLLANFQPDLIKLDMDLIREVEAKPARQIIVSGLIAMAEALGVTIIAEGVETAAELAVLRAAGINLFQGYHFAKPAFEALPPVANLSTVAQAARACVA
jgi:EAL domain-containing protein (putative c-di-GMP-specific phosphodiesterase class I)